MSNERKNQHPWELSLLFVIGIVTIILTLSIGLMYIFHWPQVIWNWLFTGLEFDGSKYLLSATAQVLGALFALVFSITLIAVQFVTKYSHQTMRIIFNWKLFFYMGGFACSVVLPLWWLLYPTAIGTYISIVTGSLVVGSLILLFLDLKRRMNIGWSIGYLKKEAIDKLGRDTDITANNIKALDNIAMGAYSDRNLEIFELAHISLGNLALGIEEKVETLEDGSQEQKLHQEIFNRIFDTAIENIKTRRAPRVLVDNLGNIGVNAVKKDLSKTWSVIPITIKSIENWCSTKENAITSLACGKALHKMAINAPESIIQRTEKDPLRVNPYDRLIHFLRLIYKKHARKKEWVEFHEDDLKDLVKLIASLLFAPNLRAQFMVAVFFEFLDLYIKDDDVSRTRHFNDELSGLIKQIKQSSSGRKLPVGILLTIIKLLDKRSEQILEDIDKGVKKDVWSFEVDKFYFRISDIADTALEYSEPFLCRWAQFTYLPKIDNKTLNVDILLETLVHQTDIILDKYPGEFDEEWVTVVSRAIKDGMDRIIQHLVLAVTRTGAITPQILWKITTPVADKLKTLAVNKKWPQAENYLNEYLALKSKLDNPPKK